MSESLPTVYLARHGETAWSLIYRSASAVSAPPGSSVSVSRE
jgi:broad specificity phosphatase PhoE